jgi:hypothetical protein
MAYNAVQGLSSGVQRHSIWRNEWINTAHNTRIFRDVHSWNSELLLSLFRTKSGLISNGPQKSHCHNCSDTAYYYWMHWCSGITLDLYTEGSQLKSQPRHQLSCCIFQTFPQCKKMSGLLPSKSYKFIYLPTIWCYTASLLITPQNPPPKRTTHCKW